MEQGTLFELAPPVSGVVYFTRCRNKVKIGYTARAAFVRVREFETGNPEPLEMIGTIDAAEDYDKVLHRDERFAPFRVRPDREWFYATPEVMSAIEVLIREEQRRRNRISISDGMLSGPWADGTYMRARIRRNGELQWIDWQVIEGYEAEAILEMRKAL